MPYPSRWSGTCPQEARLQNEVAHLIAERLKQRMSLLALPDTSLDIVQYRPFFVAGDVARPGPYPYHPHLTVLEAVATAGGTPKPGDLGLVRLGREVIDGEGELIDLAHDLDALLVRRSRLQAELAGADAIALPSRLERRKSEAAVVQLVQSETQIFNARLQAFRTQSAALQTLKVFLQKETESLKAQLGTLDTQMELINKELAGVSSLVEKGMAIAPRQMALERSVAQVQGDRLSMQTNMLRVLEEISRTDIALTELRNNRMTETSVELRDTQLKLDGDASRSETRKRLLYEAQVTAPKLISGRLRHAALQATFAIVRRVDGNAVESPASETAELNPGETVKVTMPLPDDLIEEADGAAPQAEASAQVPVRQ